MASGRYWIIHCGPEYIDDEAYYRVPVVNKTLRKLVAKIGGAIGSKARVDEVHAGICECYEGYDPCYHIIAWFDAGGDITESQLLAHLLAECGDHNTPIFRQECHLKAVEEVEYSTRCALRQ